MRVNMLVERPSMWQSMLCHFVIFILITEHDSEAMTTSSCPPFCTCDVSRRYITCSEYINAPLMYIFPNDTRQLEIQWQYWPVLNTSMFANLVHLRKLQLLSCAIEEIQDDFSKLQKLKRLDLRDNMLSDSVFNTIGQMKQLKELILDRNLLRLVQNNTFRSLEHVEILSLSWNHIEVVPSLRGLEEVQKLFLANNYITTVNGSTFGNLYNLEELYLQGNLITEMEPGWANNLRFLRHLDLSENLLGMQMTRNVIGFQKNIRLEVLSLSNNSLIYIPCLDISKTKHLIKLNLTYNFISNLENECLNRLKRLQELDLEANQIENIEDSALQEMPMLHMLVLNKNSIHTLPPYWLKGSRISSIHLRANRLVSISNSTFSGLEYLVVVFLSSNRVSSISPEAFCGTSITDLWLSYNEIRVVNASQFECAVTLSALSLDNNIIQEIHPAAFKGIYLTKLLLHANRLETITDNLIVYNDFDVLTLEDNPWVCDCRLGWMREYLDIGDNYYIRQVIELQIKCASPNDVVNGSLFLFFNRNHMVCTSFPAPLTITLILAISISIIGFVVSLNLIKLYCKFRDLQKYDAAGGNEKTHDL